MVCKIPIVATNAGGVPEIITHNYNGLLAEVKHSHQLAENVMQILNNNDLKAKLINNAYNIVKRFTKENTAKKTIEVYKTSNKKN